MYEYDIVTAMGLYGLFMLAIVGLIILALSAFIRLVYPESRRYRKILTDMFVVGKIKQIAEKEGIDILKELSEFIKIDKKAKRTYSDLDKVIEAELKEKIQEEAEKIREAKEK